MSPGRRTAVALLLVFACLLTGATPARAAEEQSRGAAQLLKKYRAIEDRLRDNAYGMPIHIESAERKGRMRGDIYSVIDHPYETLRNVMIAAPNWCDIVPLHLNVKACTFGNVRDRSVLTFYSGRKFYDPPERTFRIVYDFRAAAEGGDYFKVVLTADKGPLDTKDYRIVLQAVPLETGGVFLHFRYSYEYNLVTRMANAAYLAGLGSGKIGFSIKGRDRRGRPVYVSGIQGVVERNAMRYFLAIKAFMDTLGEPEAERFERRLGYWFDLTQRYRPQLYEMSKQDYLRYKRRERAQQQRLQKKLQAGRPLFHGDAAAG